MPPKNDWVVKLRDLVVRGQGLGSRFAVNPTKAFPGLMRLLVQLSDVPAKPVKTITQPPRKLRDLLSADENENQDEYENYLSTPEEDIGEAPRSRCCA